VANNARVKRRASDLASGFFRVRQAERPADLGAPLVGCLVHFMMSNQFVSESKMTHKECQSANINLNEDDPNWLASSSRSYVEAALNLLTCKLEPGEESLLNAESVATCMPGLTEDGLTAVIANVGRDRDSLTLSELGYALYGIAVWDHCDGDLRSMAVSHLLMPDFGRLGSKLVDELKALPESDDFMNPDVRSALYTFTFKNP
jgi:hypothetical protein